MCMLDVEEYFVCTFIGQHQNNRRTCNEKEISCFTGYRIGYDK